MFAVAASRTMAGAKCIVIEDEPEPKALPRRQVVIDASRRWLEAQRQREREKQEAEERERQEIADRRQRALDERLRIEATRTFIGQMVADAERRTPAKTIIASVAAWHGLQVADLIGPCREVPIVTARFDAIAAIYHCCVRDGRRLSLPEMGREFGGRDNSSIINGLRKRGIDRPGYNVGVRYPIQHPGEKQ